MNIIVCIKEVRDPDAPPESFKIDEISKTLKFSENVLKVVNPFDEQAIEAALRIKDSIGATVTIMIMGKSPDMVVARKGLLMGADELILLDDEAYVGGDSWSTANALAGAIRKKGEFDLIICGRQAADWNAGQAGLGIAEILAIPCVTVAKKVEVTEGKAVIEKVTDNGYDVIETSLPALVTVGSELGEARYPSIKRMRTANKVEPSCWKPGDIGLDPSGLGAKGSKTRILRLYQPVPEGECEIITGGTVEEAAENLALRLRDEKII